MADREKASAGRERSSAYGRVEELIKAQRCVLLDGGTATELDGVLPSPVRRKDEALWGTWALMHAPTAVGEVHRRYAELGCDVISTNTWGLSASMPDGEPTHWMDVARRGVTLARESIAAAGRADQAAVAFSINGDVNDSSRRELIRLLPRALEEAKPDLLLVETISLVREGQTFEMFEELVASGIPVWASFRRCRAGACGVHGQHWGGPEGDDFGRAARRLEQIGVEALLINCIPPDHVPGMVSWLRDFTDLPLGVYPNLGYATSDGWRQDDSVRPEDFAELATQWREEGAQIIGGCCGVGPEHLAATRDRIADQPLGRRRVSVEVADSHDSPPPSWLDERARNLFPLPVPEILCEPGVFVPTQGSFLVWKYLFGSGLGKGGRCLDIGCGTGLQSTQMALNGAESVHAIDLDPRAVANTLSNSFRNGVADRVTGETADLFEWVPRERYDTVVASLYQMPVDPYEEPNSHRPLDFWGRNLVDHLIAMLPRLLSDDGRAYMMLLSVLSQKRTAELVERAGFQSRVVDFAFFEFHELFKEKRRQIERVESLSDAFHLRFGETETIVAYLVEISRKDQ